jgi:hypothetical protein
MGKQIRFLLDEDTEIRFIEYVMQDQECDILLHKENWERYAIKNVSDIFDSDQYQVHLYKEEFGDVQYENMEEGWVFYKIGTPDIEYSRPIINESPEKEIIAGRLWVEMRYYDDDGILTMKDEKLDECYKQLVKWIKRNTKRKTVTMPNGETETGYMTDSMQVLLESGEYEVYGL